MPRIGVVGVGAWGENIARVLSELPTCNLSFVCDIDLRKARRVGNLYRTRYFTRLEEAIEKAKPDVVVVSTPTQTHYKVCIKALEYPLHLFVEKPIADSSLKARAIIEEAERKGVKIMVGHIERFNPVVRALKSLLEAGEFPPPSFILARRVGRPTKVSPVGVVKDLAVHDLDLMRYLLAEEPTSVFAVCGRTKRMYEDSANIILTFAKSSGYIEVDWLSPHKARRLILGSEQTFAFADLLNKRLALQIGNSLRQVPVGLEEPLKLELAHFVECVARGEQPLVSGWDGLRALEMAEAALRSARSGKPAAL